MDSRQVGIMPRAALAPPVWTTLLPRSDVGTGSVDWPGLVRQPFSRPVAGCPAPWSSDRIDGRAATGTKCHKRVPRTVTPLLTQTRHPSARWLHKSESDILFGPTSLRLSVNHGRPGINRKE